VTAISSSVMETAARAHLKTYHAGDTDLSKEGSIAKPCHCAGCFCRKPEYATAERHPVHSVTVRNHLVRTHFVGQCKELEKAAQADSP
jgi:hypothetical protein